MADTLLHNDYVKNPEPSAKAQLKAAFKEMCDSLKYAHEAESHVVKIVVSSNASPVAEKAPEIKPEIKENGKIRKIEMDFYRKNSLNRNAYERFYYDENFDESTPYSDEILSLFISNVKEEYNHLKSKGIEVSVKNAVPCHCKSTFSTKYSALDEAEFSEIKKGLGIEAKL